MAAISEIDPDMLQQVWAEMDYQLDICRVTKGGHTLHLRGIKKKKILYPSVSHMLQPFLPFKCTDFMKCVGEIRIIPLYKDLSMWVSDAKWLF